MSRSQQLLQRAREVIPGGVNSPVRAFAAVGGDPPFIARGEGPWVIDEDGQRFLDLVGSWGALLLGHAHPAVVRAATQAIERGSSFGAPTVAEIELAESIRDRVPGIDKVRLCSSGTEATMHAIRLARGATGRDLVVKMDGCYHGAHDALLVAAGSGVATFARPGSPGIPDPVASCTVVVPFNDAAAVEAVLTAHRDRVAAVIVEPVPGNMGCIPPVPGYLEALRSLTREHGALLILDEVMTGFRLARGGAQERFGVEADLNCMGKVVGGGFPLAAFGGRAELMDRLSPAGPVYQAGTLSGNPVAVAAGSATLQQLDAPAYQRLEALGARLQEALVPEAESKGFSFARVGSMFTVYAREQAPRNFAEVRTCDLDRFARLHREALKHGVYLPPSQFEAAFLNLALDESLIDRLVTVLRGAMGTV